MKSKTNFRKWSLIIPIVLLAMLSCKKDKNEITPEETATPSQPLAPPDLWDNVKIIDTTTYTLNQSPTLIGNGIYQFSFTGATPTITIGDIIVGSEGNGYLRKVSGVTLNSGNVSLQTTQARMEDVFKNGGLNFNLDMDNMHQKSASTGFSYPINNKTIYQNGPLSIIINSGQIDLNPNWFFDFGFNSTGITKFEMSAQNGTLNGNFNMSVTASQAITLFDRNDTLTHLTKSYTKMVPALLLGVPVLVPIVVIIDVDLIVNYSATIGAAISKSGTYTSNNTFNLGVRYSNSQWSGINNFNPTNTFSLNPQSSGNANMTVNLGLTPHVSVKLYGVAGPYASVGLQEQLTGNIALPQLDWDFKTDVWVKAIAGASIDVLGYTLADYSNSWETTKLSYITPYQISIVSGNNQNGQFGQQLFNPLKVRVTDSKGISQSNVPVYFSVAGGGGSLSTASVLTDASGNAETNWTLGSSGNQTVNASVKKADGSQITNSPISFSATNAGGSAWTIYNVANSGLPSNNLSAIAIDALGNKWIGTDAGLAKFDGTTWTIYNTSNSGLPDNNIVAITIDASGNKWIGTFYGGLAKFDGNTWTIYNYANTGLGLDQLNSVTVDAIANIWIGTTSGVALFDGSTWLEYTYLNSQLPYSGVNSVAIDANGNKWIGSEGLFKFDGSNWMAYTTSNSGIPINNANSIAIDASGNKWIATGNDLTRFDGTNWTVYTNAITGINGAVESIAIATSGNKWFGSHGQVTKFDGSTWTSYHQYNSGYPGSFQAYSIAIDANENKWVATGGGGLAKFQ
jgi:hypothetical protein